MANFFRLLLHTGRHERLLNAQRASDQELPEILRRGQPCTLAHRW